jgi:hypothetical protein
VRADEHASTERDPLVDARPCGFDDAAELNEVEATASVIIIEGDRLIGVEGSPYTP